MSKEFKLKFNNGEETLADQFEATYGSRRGTILKEYIRSLLTGGVNPQNRKTNTKTDPQSWNQS